MYKIQKCSPYKTTTKLSTIWFTLTLTLTSALASFNLQAAGTFNAKTCDKVFTETKANQACHLALKGDPKASYSMARIFADAKNSAIMNMDYAYFWHLKLARQILKQNLTEPAYIDILYNAGVLYNDGLGTPKNFKKAFYWFKQAASRGHALAMVRLVLAYQNGQGTSKDETKALEWLQKAVNLNNPEAQVLMAKKIMQGSDKKTELDKGIKLLKSAAKQNSAQANFILGNYYLRPQNGQQPPQLNQAKNYYGNSCKLNLLIGCKRYYDLDNLAQKPATPFPQK